MCCKLKYLFFSILFFSACMNTNKALLVMNYRHDVCQSCFPKFESFLNKNHIKYLLVIKNPIMDERGYYKYIRHNVGMKSRNIQLDDKRQRLRDYRVFDFIDSATLNDYFKKNKYFNSYDQFRGSLDSLVKANSYCPPKNQP